MLVFELTYLFFLFGQRLPGLFEMALQELSRIFGLFLPCFQILADEEVRQFLGDLLRHVRIA